MCLKVKGKGQTRIHIIRSTWTCVASAGTLPGTPTECDTLLWTKHHRDVLHQPYWGEQTSSDHRQMHTFQLWQLPTHWATEIRQLSLSKPVSRGGSANPDYLIHCRGRSVCKQVLTVSQMLFTETWVPGQDKSQTLCCVTALPLLQRSLQHMLRYRRLCSQYCWKPPFGQTVYGSSRPSRYSSDQENMHLVPGREPNLMPHSQGVNHTLCTWSTQEVECFLTGVKHWEYTPCFAPWTTF